MALVISAVVALAALGGAGFYLYTCIAADADAEAVLTQSRATLQEFQAKTPFPSKDNVEAVKEQQQVLKSFLKGAQNYFPKFPEMSSEITNNFSEFLAKNLAEMRGAAEASKVATPTNYAFKLRHAEGTVAVRHR